MEHGFRLQIEPVGDLLSFYDDADSIQKHGRNIFRYPANLSLFRGVTDYDLQKNREEHATVYDGVHYSLDYLTVSPSLRVAVNRMMREAALMPVPKLPCIMQYHTTRETRVLATSEPLSKIAMPLSRQGLTELSGAERIPKHELDGITEHDWRKGWGDPSEALYLVTDDPPIAVEARYRFSPQSLYHLSRMTAWYEENGKDIPKFSPIRGLNTTNIKGSNLDAHFVAATNVHRFNEVERLLMEDDQYRDVRLLRRRDNVVFYSLLRQAYGRDHATTLTRPRYTGAEFAVLAAIHTMPYSCCVVVLDNQSNTTTQGSYDPLDGERHLDSRTDKTLGEIATTKALAVATWFVDHTWGPKSYVRAILLSFGRMEDTRAVVTGARGEPVHVGKVAEERILSFFIDSVSGRSWFEERDEIEIVAPAWALLALYWHGMFQKLFVKSKKYRIRFYDLDDNRIAVMKHESRFCKFKLVRMASLSKDVVPSEMMEVDEVPQVNEQWRCSGD